MLPDARTEARGLWLAWIDGLSTPLHSSHCSTRKPIIFHAQIRRESSVSGQGWPFCETAPKSFPIAIIIELVQDMVTKNCRSLS